MMRRMFMFIHTFFRILLYCKALCPVAEENKWNILFYFSEINSMLSKYPLHIFYLKINLARNIN